jgi:hypothetical protein
MQVDDDVIDDATVHFSETHYRLPLKVEWHQVFPYLGYPRGSSPSPELRLQTERIVARGFSHLKPRGTYSLYSVTARTPRSLSVGDVEIVGDIGEFLRPVDRIATFIVTVGEEISQFAQQASQTGDTLSGWVLDALGSWAAEATAEALMVPFRAQLDADQIPTVRFSPGYCGMDITQQRAIFALSRAESIGVSLLPSLLMHPIKSVSGLVGVGSKDIAGLDRPPCDRCAQVGCHMRR